MQANRIWARMFRGLVETEEDFGRQGTVPTHPELLDALAARWLADEGRLRPFLKRLLMTDACRTSTATPEGLAADPRNDRLARFPRVRLEPEVLRDQRSRFPICSYAPSTARRSIPATRWRVAESIQRRTLDQQHRKRSIPPECVHLLEAARAASHDDVVRRAQPGSVHLAARHQYAAAGVGGFERSDLSSHRLGFGRRIQGLSGDERAIGRRVPFADRSRAQHVGSAAVATPPEQARRHYADRPDEAAAFVAAFAEARRVEVGREMSAEEESAWALVASVLLNLDEVLCRG